MWESFKFIAMLKHNSDLCCWFARELSFPRVAGLSSVMDTTVDKEKIIQLWRDPDFEGSYTGIKTFQTLLKLNKDIDISERKLYEILKNDPIFVMHIRSKKTIQRNSKKSLTQWAVYKRTPHLGCCKSFLIQTLSHTLVPSKSKYQNNYHTLSRLHKLNKAMIGSQDLSNWEGNNLENSRAQSEFA